MSKVFLLRDLDFDALTTEIDRDPRWGVKGGSSTVMSETERAAHDRAHQFFNYVVRNWIERMKR